MAIDACEEVGVSVGWTDDVYMDNVKTCIWGRKKCHNNEDEVNLRVIQLLRRGPMLAMIVWIGFVGL